jgi:Tol biopolymer transport system component
MPDGKQVHFSGDDGHGWRVYVQDLAGAAPRAITPLILVKLPYYEFHTIFPDGKLIFARDTSGKARLYPVAGGETHAIPGWLPEDIWSTWSADGRSAYAYHDEKVSASVYRLDVAAGRRNLVATLGPSDVVGVTSILSVTLTPDGKSYAYSYSRNLSDLFLVEGVR